MVTFFLEGCANEATGFGIFRAVMGEVIFFLVGDDFADTGLTCDLSSMIGFFKIDFVTGKGEDEGFSSGAGFLFVSACFTGQKSA